MKGSEDLDRAMAALADGDRGAFDEVFTALWPKCRSFARRTLGDDALGDDAAQTALEKLFFQAPHYRKDRPVTAWALTLTWYECRTLMKKRARRGEAPLVEVESSHTSPDERAVTRDLITRALDVVDGLADRDRQAVLSTLSDDERGPLDAAERKQRQRALSRLRALWSSLHD